MINEGLDRIIPAYAGSTLAWRPACPLSRDHPRVCGEHDGFKGFQRGNAGIIPAYAGSTRATLVRLRRCRDHPRVCGEHPSSHSMRSCSMGLSPRMRGARVGVAQIHDSLGIIPAYAGSTDLGRRVAVIGRDHPRVCGEHALIALPRKPAMGSSPRMRGARMASVNWFQFSGIIPAYAGSTRRSP